MMQGSLGLRHWCEQGDQLKQFGWNKHDGREFGLQTIIDRTVKLETSFIKVAGGEHGGDWSNRIAVSGPRGTEVQRALVCLGPYCAVKVSVLYYAALEEGSAGSLEPRYDDTGRLVGVVGQSPTLASWNLWWEPSPGTAVTDRYHIATQTAGLHTITDTVMRSFRSHH